ncbi:MAG: trypsin-like serine protease [Myxococcota bacterium]
MRWLVPLLLTTTACGEAVLPDLTVAGEARERLTDGTEHTGNPEVNRVFFVLDPDLMSEGACTATLVGPSTVLTAAHCLVYTDTEYQAGRVVYPTAEVIVHPDYRGSRPWEYDIGLVVLDAQIDDVEPALLFPDPVELGEPLTLIGFGRTAADATDSSGIKRIAQNAVDDIEPLYFVSEDTGDGEGNGCSGDSGGPTYVEREQGAAIAGLMSFVPNLGSAGCGPSMRSTPISLFLDWIQEQAPEVRILDLIPPTLEVNGLENEGTVEPGQAYTYSAADEQNLDRVEVVVNGTPASTEFSASGTLSVPDAPGDYSISLTAFDATGNSETAEFTITVAQPASDPEPAPDPEPTPSPDPTPDPSGETPVDEPDPFSDSTSTSGCQSLPAAPLAVSVLALRRRRRQRTPRR